MAFAEREPEEALLLFSKFSRECLDDPDHYIFSSVIKACTGLATERHCSTVHAQVMKYGFESDTIIANALIHAYSRCGSVELSMQVFDFMEVRDMYLGTRCSGLMPCMVEEERHCIFPHKWTSNPMPPPL
ncbi:hypothetical protein GIB67_022342 [Kingdonia uniflora]|uniref:Pentatricopeptide repeat-containing protein n=1 Tax=Kingdonia uniflora TaxID=39325 RepID=A0A7J7N6F5_9MAGN|nr:hypothetical protein GIB67_022342 [Kingdonia uniflora]